MSRGTVAKVETFSIMVIVSYCLISLGLVHTVQCGAVLRTTQLAAQTVVIHP